MVVASPARSERYWSDGGVSFCMLLCSVGVIRTANGMKKRAKFTKRSVARAVALFPYVVHEWCVGA